MIALAPSTFMANATTPINKSNFFTKVWQGIHAHSSVARLLLAPARFL
jgi:hypothetical protein